MLSMKGGDYGKVLLTLQVLFTYKLKETPME